MNHFQSSHCRRKRLTSHVLVLDSHFPHLPIEQEWYSTLYQVIITLIVDSSRQLTLNKFPAHTRSSLCLHPSTTSISSGRSHNLSLVSATLSQLDCLQSILGGEMSNTMLLHIVVSFNKHETVS